MAFCRHNVPTVAGSHVTGGGLSLAQLDPDGRPVKLLPSRRILPPFLQAAKCKTTVPRHVWDRHRSDTHVLKKNTFKYHNTHYHEVVYNILATFWRFIGFPNEFSCLLPTGDLFLSKVVAASLLPCGWYFKPFVSNRARRCARLRIIERSHQEPGELHDEGKGCESQREADVESCFCCYRVVLFNH